MVGRVEGAVQHTLWLRFPWFPARSGTRSVPTASVPTVRMFQSRESSPDTGWRGPSCRRSTWRCGAPALPVLRVLSGQLSGEIITSRSERPFAAPRAWQPSPL